jgi:hypothetical protein
VFGSKEQGFDPIETRFYRKKQKDIGGCWSFSNNMSICFVWHEIIAVFHKRKCLVFKYKYNIDC